MTAQAAALARHAREIADANAAILRLQKQLDAAVAESESWKHRYHTQAVTLDCARAMSILGAVRPVVAAAVAMRLDKRDESENDSAAYVLDAVDALPADVREWATKGE